MVWVWVWMGLEGDVRAGDDATIDVVSMCGDGCGDAMCGGGGMCWMGDCGGLSIFMGLCSAMWGVDTTWALLWICGDGMVIDAVGGDSSMVVEAVAELAGLAGAAFFTGLMGSLSTYLSSSLSDASTARSTSRSRWPDFFIHASIWGRHTSRGAVSAYMSESDGITDVARRVGTWSPVLGSVSMTVGVAAADDWSLASSVSDESGLSVSSYWRRSLTMASRRRFAFSDRSDRGSSESTISSGRLLLANENGSRDRATSMVG